MESKSECSNPPPAKRRKLGKKKNKKNRSGSGVSKGSVRNPTSSSYVLKPRGGCKLCKTSSGFTGTPIDSFALLGSVSPGGKVSWRCITGAHLDDTHACVTARIAKKARDVCGSLEAIPWDTLHASHASDELRTDVIQALAMICDE